LFQPKGRSEIDALDAARSTREQRLKIEHPAFGRQTSYIPTAHAAVLDRHISIRSFTVFWRVLRMLLKNRLQAAIDVKITVLSRVSLQQIFMTR